MDDLVRRARDFLVGVSKGPWAYRPQEFDDWGYVRQADPDADGWRHFICQVKSPMLSDDGLNDCRKRGIDPWGRDAKFIAESRDLIPAMADRIEALTAERNVWRETLQSMTPGGSEYTTPKECASFVTQEREKRHKMRVEKVLANRKVAALTADNERLQARVDALEEQNQDTLHTLNAWFDRRKLAHEAIDDTVVNAASGYLRTSRSGGMSQEESDLVLGVIRDMARLSVFADLFARAALKENNDE